MDWLRNLGKVAGLVGVALAVALTGTACGDDDDGGSGGSGGFWNDGGSGGKGQPEGLLMNAALGFKLVEEPFSNEDGPVTGLLLLTRWVDGEEANVLGATVTLNGVELAESDWLEGFYSSDGLPIEAEPGGTLDFVASEGGDTATMSLPCPGGIAITSPTPGTALRPGDEVTVTWSGNISYETGIFNPTVVIRTFDSAADEVDRMHPDDEQQASIDSGDTSATLVVPEVDGGDGFVIDFTVPGDFILDGGHAGICMVQVRAKYTVGS